MAEKQIEKKDIKSLDFDELKEFIESIGEKGFRAKQVYGWIHKKLVPSFDDMANVPKELREKFKKSCTITSTNVIKKQVSADGT